MRILCRTRQKDADLPTDVEKPRALPPQISLAEVRDRQYYTKYSNRLNYFTLTMVLITVILNIITITRSSTKCDNPSSPYAHLRRTREEPYVQVTDYYASPNNSNSNNNNTIQDSLWDTINIDDGVVALSDKYASKHDLPTAQLRFPWDTTKGVYVLHGFHNLYCVKSIHASLSEFRAGEPQSSSWGHVSYCLNALRRQILCDADDTPRATERRGDVGGGGDGGGQQRKCRDWDGLVEFAKENTACYRQPGGGDGDDDGNSVLERFKHCPQGSGYVVDDNYVSKDAGFVGLPGKTIV